MPELNERPRLGSRSTRTLYTFSGRLRGLVVKFHVCKAPELSESMTILLFEADPSLNQRIIHPRQAFPSHNRARWY